LTAAQRDVTLPNPTADTREKSVSEFVAVGTQLTTFFWAAVKSGGNCGWLGLEQLQMHKPHVMKAKMVHQADQQTNQLAYTKLLNPIESETWTQMYSQTKEHMLSLIQVLK
jgi:hypothetical protein